MFIEDCYKLGFIYKAYGIKGELIIRTNLELSQDIIKEWESIFIEINGILVPFFIEEINKKSDIELQIKLEDIDDEIEAKVYLGQEVYLDKSVLNVEQSNNFSWLNFQIKNSEGVFIGEIIEIMEFPGQDMLKISTRTADEIIIPAIEDWIIEVKTEENIIVMDLPSGLINLNLTEENIF